MKLSVATLVSALHLTVLASATSSDLERGFANPPPSTKPWCYYYWISDNLSREGISRDLEAMARVGIGEALIGNIFLDEVAPGPIKALSEEWWQLIEHTLREGDRLGVNIGLFNCPGWSQSGGPWIKPEQTMRYLASSEIRITGPRVFAEKLSAPRTDFQDVAVLAFPEPSHDADALVAKSPRLNCTPAVAADPLVDGRLDTKVVFPEGAGRHGTAFTVEIELATPIIARTLKLFPANDPFSAKVEFQTEVAGTYQTIREFRCDWSNLATAVGFIPQAPMSISFPAITARRFRLLFTDVTHGHRDFVPQHTASLAEIEISGAARLESFVEKQLGKMHPTPLALGDAYRWPKPMEPETSDLVIPVTAVRDLTQELAEDGTLTWNVPPGNWVILRTGMTPTGMSNSPASPQAKGFEVDKMNRQLAQHHFDAFIGQLLRRVPPAERKALKRVVADSYEMGAQNWTDDFDQPFRRRYGYDPKPWLPVLTGRLVGSADQSERFLWDLRRLVADQVATEYVGGLRDACREHGLELWLENYGHWGFPSEFLKYGREADGIGGEFWVTGDLGSIECRAASSCANIYGKRIVSAESFTGGPAFQNAPRGLKARGDWSFCEGINHVVLHVYIHQPWQDRIPGVNAPWGTEFNRHNTWFARSPAWIDYERRCCWLLQQGWRVADVAYFIGEDTPKMTGTQHPPRPDGFDFDFINADVIEHQLRVQKGMLTLPHGTQYRVLVLPDQTTMRPEVLRKIRDLVKAGATVVGSPPTRSPSLQHFPQADEEVRALAAELWGATRSGERRFGKGRLFVEATLEEVFARLRVQPDFQSETRLRYTHRRDGGTDIYFLANPQPEAIATVAAFRVGDRMPEFWWPETGRIEYPAVYRTTNGMVNLPLQLGPHGSLFVVFRRPAERPARQIVAVKQGDQEILRTDLRTVAAESAGGGSNNFSFAVWVRPTDDTTLVRPATAGVVGMGEPRNDALSAPHGAGWGGAGHVGCGLAVGRNGVAVFEHGNNYFAPPLVLAASLTNWTHVTVVYRDGQPTLYLDGRRVQTGLRSPHTVHSGVGRGSSAQFRGNLGRFASFDRSLDDAEVAAIARSMPRPDQLTTEPGITLTRTAHGLRAEALTAGDYELRLASGQLRREKFADLPSPQAIPGPWQVSFAPGWGAPEMVTFSELLSWPEHADPGIRFYSGTALYRTTFQWSKPLPSEPDARLWLDLGEVRDVATVRLNGQELGALWLFPWRVDATAALKPGANVLEVEVINPWNNRLAGDAQLPAQDRRTFLTVPTVNQDTPLLPAGLLGPVTLRSAAARTTR